jgi:DNA-binding PucR family transcriptional regulator
VLLPLAQTRGLAAQFGQSTLQLSEDLPGVEASESLAVLLVPDMAGPVRRQLLTALAGRKALVGPARPWIHARASYHRALRAREVVSTDKVEAAIDTDDHLVELVLGADRDAADDLRARVLAPLSQLPPNTADRLTETLRSWVLHQGRRDAVAADLFIHAQTVRYRMAQLRELYGDRLSDPQTVLALTVALGPGAPRAN